MIAPWHESEQAPCFCELESSEPLTTQEFCPAHGDPDKPVMDAPPAERYWLDTLGDTP